MKVFLMSSGEPRKISSVIKKVVAIVGKGKPIFGKRKDISENMALYANIDKIKKILNWHPKISFDEGLRKTINSFR